MARVWTARGGPVRRSVVRLLARLPLAWRERAYAGSVWLLDTIAESLPPAMDDETRERGRREFLAAAERYAAACRPWVGSNGRFNHDA